MIKKDEDGDFRKVMSLLSKESELGCAVVGAIALDVMLEQIIKNYMKLNSSIEKKLLGVGRPLESFGSRALCAHALGLISKEIHQALDLVGRVRNKFAHNFEKSFKDEDILGLCKEIKKLIKSEATTARGIYENSIGYLSGSLSVILEVCEDFDISGNFKYNLEKQNK